MPDEVRWQRRAGVLERRLLDGIVLLGPDAPQPLALSLTARAVWDLLASDRSLPEMSQWFTAELVDVPDDVVAQLRELLDELEKHGLVQAVTT